MVTLVLEELLQAEAFSRIVNWIYKNSEKSLKHINKNRKLIKLEKISKEDYLEFIKFNFIENFNWASNISFREASDIKNTNEVFVMTDIFLTPRRQQMEKEGQTISFGHLLDDFDNSFILYGEPGSGKTTSIKKIFLDYFSRQNETLNHFGYVLVLKLKDINVYEQDKGELLILKKILSSLNISFWFNPEQTLDKENKIETLYYLIIDFLEDTKMLLIFDGFDEINNEEIKRNLVKVLRRFSLHLRESKFILTSRPNAFNFYVENTKEFEISPLNNDQIKLFINNWFKEKIYSEELFALIEKATYFDTSRRPLALANLCAIYEREKSIPSKPKSIYLKIIYLLLEDWDNQRQIKRVSRYSKFETDRKIDFLSRFSFELTIVCQTQIFSRELIGIIYDIICEDFELPKNESLNVIEEIISHSGLIRQVFYDKYEFSHKSLQEYFVANYMIRLPRLIQNVEVLLRIPNELAIVVSLSSTPELLLFELICENLKVNMFQNNFISEFIKRLEIEKPDFRPNILLPVTLIYIQDYIIRILYPVYTEMKTNTLSNEIDLQEQKNELKTLENIYNDIDKFIKNEDIDLGKRLIKNYRKTKTVEKRYSLLEKRTVKKWQLFMCDEPSITINSIDVMLPKRIISKLN